MVWYDLVNPAQSQDRELISRAIMTGWQASARACQPGRQISTYKLQRQEGSSWTTANMPTASQHLSGDLKQRAAAGEAIAHSLSICRAGNSGNLVPTQLQVQQWPAVARSGQHLTCCQVEDWSFCGSAILMLRHTSAQFCSLGLVCSSRGTVKTLREAG